MSSLRSLAISVVAMLLGFNVYSVAAGRVRLYDPNELVNENFGWSVAKSGSTVVVGAPSGQYQGVAYVFVHVSGEWQEAAELMASNGAVGDWFGGSVAIASNGTIAVGAPYASGDGYLHGAAYVFLPPDGGWTPGNAVINETANLRPTNATTNDLFGQSITISGDGLRVVVGAPQSFGSSSPGTVYLFLKSAGWNQVKVVHASDGFGGDGFGCSVSISGYVAVVGAYGANAAYVIGGPNYTQTKLLPWDNNAVGFGGSVSIGGNVTVVGSGTTERGVGEVFVFTNQAGIWTPTTTLTSNEGSGFGSSVATDGLITVVGLPGFEIGKGNHNGAIVVFNSAWQQLGIVAGGVNDGMGKAAVSGQTVIAGASSWEDGRGQAFVLSP